MACFIMPLITAIITTLIQKISRDLSRKLKLSLLNAMLWGGVFLLILEHIWHGEVVPWPPFLTAMSNPAEIPVMLHEIATTGTIMTTAIIGSWGTILLLTRNNIAKAIKTKTITQKGFIKPDQV